jgi:hypothetical protein
VANPVYFLKFRVTNETGNVHMLLSSAPMAQAKADILGFHVGIRTQPADLKIGILPLTDPITGQGLKPTHPSILGLQAKLKVGMEVPGLQIDTENTYPVGADGTTYYKVVQTA